MLEIVRIYLNNPLENYNYIIVDQQSGLAVAVDPLDAERVYFELERRQLKLAAIFVTHEHADHYQGSKPLAALTNVPIYAHHSNITHLPQVDCVLKEADTVKLSEILIFNVLETPGHIKGHISFFMLNTPDNIPRLICGDTLFNAGVGNCRHPSANVETLFKSIEKIRQLPLDTQIYPGHDYILKNLAFAHTVDPDNNKIVKLMEAVSKQTPETRQITDLALESQVNPFFRLNRIDQFKNQPALEAFRKLRQLRDKF
ncbi:hydroxyacylglutathione hydrolase [Thiotrichales bacterium 19S3-7]|nr:hydroxyacylglutathione hydrolase [Thiotrichales bacterium 19S3-7]MCF6801604.1 hydroxyacylglutathione hydrolase [Thiotrichales bacterium 19S3-11]